MFGRGAAGVDWEELLSRNPCLTSRLTLDETPLADFLGAVWQLDSGEYCAHLARLKLEGAHLRSPTSANSSSLSGRRASQGGESFEMMREWLAHRASYGIPLEELHLKLCVRLRAQRTRRFSGSMFPALSGMVWSNTTKVKMTMRRGK